MSSEVVIDAKGLGKAYLIYSKPQDRLKQMFLRGYRKLYREYWAFQNVDFQVRRGETVGIIGRNGSGKSTLLQVIAGTLQPSSGTISVTGRIAPLLELGAGFNPEFTGRENVVLAASVMGLSTQQIDERFDSILEFAGIDEFIDQPVKSYSSGMYARLAFAVAAHVDADILIVDEILAVGDAAFVQRCMRWIRKFKETGTILFVSHDSAAVNALCDRVIWMDKGELRAEGPPQDIGFLYQAALYEEVDSEGFTIARRQAHAKREPVRDQRHDAIKHSDKRNLLEVFKFDASANSFGAGGARITDTHFVMADGSDIPVVEGGEMLTLCISGIAARHLSSPIVGFLVRDRTGQTLFGDNTYLSYQHTAINVDGGSKFEARFTFQMPYLPAGDYSIAVAIAEGTQQDHVQHHWIDDALIFQCSGSHVTQGLIGIPMSNITLSITPE